MKVFFAFNHPAPYKVRAFNFINKEIDIFVIFERTKAKDRPDAFYNCNNYDFPHLFLKGGYFGNEQTRSGKLRKYLKEHHQEYDLIVMNGYSKIAEMKAIRYLIKHNIPYILQINGGVIKKESKLKKRIKSYYISHASKYLSAAYGADEYLLYYGARKEDINHYPYSTLELKDIIDKPLSKKEKEDIRKELGMPSSPLFISDSQFIARKNNQYLIELFKDVDANLLLVGQGKEEQLYKKIIKEKDIRNVYLHPFVKKDALYKMLQASDYFITLSKEDIYGHTTLEALANGLPVISSNRIISSKEIIKNGHNGYLVDINDEKKIKDAIKEISKIDNTNCLNSVKTYTIENSAKRIIEILKEIKL